MAFKYKNVVPWGRSYREYVKMFNLSEAEQSKRILGCGDGPASFNCVMTKLGKTVVSFDPIYHMTADELSARIDETYEDVIGQTRKNKEKFIWKEIPSVDELGKIRMTAMKEFLTDFEKGKMEKRYIPGELPALPFADETFDIALSSHFLFLYTDNLSLEFHIESIREMMRVAKEARIFPILDVNGVVSSYVEAVTESLKNDELEVSIDKVPYEFQKGGDCMMRIINA